MQFYQHVGIAIATAIASWLNCLLLFYILLKSKEFVFDKLLKENFKKTSTVDSGCFYHFVRNRNVVISKKHCRET